MHKIRQRLLDGNPIVDTARRLELETDVELVQRVLNHDPEGKEEFVRRFRRVIYGAVIQSGLPVQEQEDMFAQVFIHLLDDNGRRLRQWKPCGLLSSFLFRVTHNYIADHDDRQSRWRQKDVEIGMLLDDTSESFELSLHQRIQKEAVDRSLCNLPARDAELIFRRHYLEQTYEEMASALGMAVNAVGVNLLRAKKRLRAMLLQTYPTLFSEEAAFFRKEKENAHHEQ